MDYFAEIVSYLKTNPLKHIVHLKMIEAYGENMVCHYEQNDAHMGVVLLLPTQASPFDAKTYPDSKFIVLLAATDQEILQRIIPHVPRKANLVFKLVDGMTRQAILQQFPSQRVTAFLSYTTKAPRFHSHPSVVVSNVLDERVMPSYLENGYISQEMAHYFERGAISFTIYDRTQPLSTCFAFRNYETIWEVGGVHTAPSQRRQGLANQVVETALHYVGVHGWIPRYQVKETNLPSIRLAESLGLEHFVTTEHFLYNGVSS